MSNYSWGRAPLPEESWTTVPAPDNSTFVQPSDSDWQSHVHGVTNQEAPFLQHAAWLHAPTNHIDPGLSPVLSHESQSSHTLNALSEPDVPAMPSSLEMSFPTEPSWSAHGPTEYPAYQAFHPSADRVYPSAPSQVPYGHHPWDGQGVPIAPHYHGPQVSQPGYFSYADRPMHPGRAMSYQAVHARPLLPRTQSPAVPSQPVYGPQRILRPQKSVVHDTQSTVPTVSSVPGHAHGVLSHTPVLMTASGPLPSPALQRQSSGANHAVAPMRAQPSSEVIPVAYPGDQNEDWSSFVHFDHEEQPITPGPVRSIQPSQRIQRDETDALCSYAPGYKPGTTIATGVVPDGAHPTLSVAERNAAPSSQEVSTGVVASPMENDEGRYRSHPLYNEGPHADGLYHCPFRNEPTCQHKPTKLKCNYDKFIDSHIKPFRCKLEACAKQEFSSTACLLRHEREAHGMHGHGDRPHLCYYPGCERGMTGNGFPRRYNLFDHMKRVHDHKDESSSLTGSPVVATEPKGQRRPSGRKRKASGSAPAEPVAQRQRNIPTRSPASHPPSASTPVPQSVPAHVQGPQAVPMVLPGYHPMYARYPFAGQGHEQVNKAQHRQRQLYSQWANQREILSRQMDNVQSPDDEATLQHLSQNIEELRRLSQEARRG